MGITYNPDRADVLDRGYLGAKKAVSDAAQVLIAVGASNLEKRQLLYVENTGDTVCYFGPSGVSASGVAQGAMLHPSQWFWLSLGPNQSMFAICDAGDSTELVIQEWA